MGTAAGYTLIDYAKKNLYRIKELNVQPVMELMENRISN
jgi:hypothetical protein